MFLHCPCLGMRRRHRHHDQKMTLDRHWTTFLKTSTMFSHVSTYPRSPSEARYPPNLTSNIQHPTSNMRACSWSGEKDLVDCHGDMAHPRAMQRIARAQHASVLVATPTSIEMFRNNRPVACQVGPEDTMKRPAGRRACLSNLDFSNQFGREAVLHCLSQLGQNEREKRDLRSDYC